MKMIETRNKTSDTYNPHIAQTVVTDILERFFPAFESMAKKFTAIND
jgi:hypothetical protein